MPGSLQVRRSAAPENHSAALEPGRVGVQEPTAINRTKTSKPSEWRPSLPDALPYIPSLENLEEITVWLGTFRERLRIANVEDQPKLEATDFKEVI